jgi:hypothetical protein
VIALEAFVAPKAEAKTLTGIDAGFHRIRLPLRDLAVFQHLVDGLQLCLLERVLRLGRRQVQDPGQLVDKDGDGAASTAATPMITAARAAAGRTIQRFNFIRDLSFLGF